VNDKAVTVDIQPLERRELAYLRREARQLVVGEIQPLERREMADLGREARQWVVGEIYIRHNIQTIGKGETR
jgi:hypothetical protein